MAGLAFYTAHRVDEREAARLALAARADKRHAQILAGDDRGIYGEYTPQKIEKVCRPTALSRAKLRGVRSRGIACIARIFSVR